MFIEREKTCLDRIVGRQRLLKDEDEDEDEDDVR